ncbi:MAG: DUF6273 domain-containing protein [Eubacteriales bacterium]|nr:DUF6273 domain-containing protein [Eubacteriales bacterium]
MRKFKCYKCGSSITFEDGVTQVTCESCGAVNALPKERTENEAQEEITPDETQGETKEDKQNGESATTSQNVNANVTALLKRIYLFLEDKEWDSADSYCEKVLDLDPENSEAYLGKVLAAWHVSKKEDLKKSTQSIHDNPNFEKACRFASEDLRKELEEINAGLEERLGAEKQKRDSITKKMLVILSAVIGVWALFAIVIPLVRYNIAGRYMEKKNYEKAYTIYKKIEGFSDARQRKNEAQFLYAKDLFYQKDYMRSYKIVRDCNAVPSTENIVNKNTLYFGNYEIDDNTENGTEAIPWIVQKTVNNKALLISKYGIEYLPFNDEETDEADIAWEDCSLRNWLNETFIETAFKEEERARIIKSSDVEHAEDETIVGEDVEDQIFLLSAKEAESLYQDDASRVCILTPYADNKSKDPIVKPCWLLRSDTRNRNIDQVSYWGKIYHSYGINDDMVIRPVMWVDLS